MIFTMGNGQYRGKGRYYVYWALLIQIVSYTPQPADGSFGAQPIPGRDTGYPEGPVMVEQAVPGSGFLWTWVSVSLQT